MDGFLMTPWKDFYCEDRNCMSCRNGSRHWGLKQRIYIGAWWVAVLVVMAVALAFMDYPGVDL